MRLRYERAACRRLFDAEYAAVMPAATFRRESLI